MVNKIMSKYEKRRTERWWSPSKQKVTKVLGNPHATATKAANFDSNVYSHLISYVSTKVSMYVCVCGVTLIATTSFPKEIGIREINRHWVSVFVLYSFISFCTTNYYKKN